MLMDAYETPSIEITTDISNDNAHVSSQLFGVQSMITGLALFGLLMFHVTSFFAKRSLKLVESSSKALFGIDSNISNNNNDNISYRFGANTVGVKINYNQNTNAHDQTRDYGHGHRVHFNIEHQLRHSKSQQDLACASVTTQSLLKLMTHFFI